ncbi:hypothetical protein BDF21DRAFT_423148 [Thamnidium elegans]|nr:hypothetical protein BDF21DRAFT_423148 [Thamnidium elegans]
MEIDAEITNTPVVNFKPNTQHCVAYCIDDTFDIKHIISSVSASVEFTVASNSSSNMIHILDQLHGGDIYLFSNGTFACWGLNQLQQEKFISHHLEKSTIAGLEAKENVEYIIDEDELTDVKGDMILLNPHVPSIHLSKVAFSYGLGRAAKLTSIEGMLDTYLNQFDQLLNKQVSQQLSKRNLEAQLVAVRQRMVRGSQDGLLGTADFQWAKLELQEYVKKISSRFDVYTRIQILNKKIEYAVYVTDIYK